MKVLIADDEKMSRIMLRSMLSEINLPLELVGEAADGEEMITKIKTLQPSTVIADIRMPRLNGLEAIKKIKNDFANIQWIILTGFSEFQYAKQSIDLGVHRYLLKPVNPEELQHALNEIYVQYRQSCMNHNKDFESDLICITSGLKSSNQYHARFLNPSFSGLIFHFDSALDTELRNQRQQKFFEDIRTDIEKLADESVNFAVISLSDAEIAVIIVFNLKSAKNKILLKRSYFSQFMQRVHSDCGDYFVITSIELPDYENFLSLEQEIKHLQKVISVRVIHQLGKRLSVEDLKLYSQEKALIKICNSLTQLQTYYIKNDYLNFTKLASELEIIFHNDTLLTKDMKTNVAFYLKAAMDCDVGSTETLRQWGNIIKQRGEAILAETSIRHDNDCMIDQVKKYIDENYMKEIGITEISDILNISPNYLSTLFHKKIGLTFTKYLTNTRMLKAKELLLNSNNKVQYVANSVGYYNTRYFTKLFKSYYNYYPSDVNKSCT